MARYIDANEALRMMRNVKSDKPSYGTWDMACDCCVDSVDVTPTADVAEVKHGEWITLEAEIGLYSCSLCEHKILRAECNYCPNCGAKMDVSKKEITTE